MLLVCMCIFGAGTAWGETATINFGNNGTKINGASVTGDDDKGNTWTITTVFGSAGSSFTQQPSYSQVGSANKPATSITFTTTLPQSANITSLSAKFGGFSGTVGTVTLSVGNNTVGTGSLDGTSDVTVTSTSAAEGTVLTVTLTDIAKGVKCYNISYTYNTGGSQTETCATPTFSPDAGAVTKGTQVTISTTTEGATIYYTTDGTTPSATNGTQGTSVTINEALTLKAIAVKEGFDNSGVATAAYTIAKVAKPTFSPEAGTVDAGTEVTISTTTEGATIYYTTDGSTPSATNGTQGTSVTINETTIINAIAVKSDMADSNVATAEYTVAGASVSGYTIDFESALISYVDWTIENAGLGSSDITAHGGTFYGTTGGKATASFQTTAAIANPGTFTCYVSKQSSNTTASTWYIQVSEDGIEWTDVETSSATDMSKGVWKKFTADLSSYADVYVRLYYSGTTAVRNVDDIELTMASSVATPVISLESGTYIGAKSVTITAEDGASIYYTLDGSTPTSESTAYSSDISITESCTLKAIAVKDGVSSNVADATYTIVITEGSGTLEDPYTAADANLVAEMLLEDVYVKGIISEIKSLNVEKYKRAQYCISDDGTKTNQFLVYNGYYLNGADFTSNDQIQIGDEVVVYGDLTVYGTTKEFAADNYIVSQAVPVEITSARAASFSSLKALDFTNTGLTANIVTGKNGSYFTSQPVTVVPANTGLVVEGDAETYYIPVAAADADFDDVEDNLLVSTASEAYIVTSDDYGFVYGLARSKSSETVGFQKKAEGFSFGIGKSYLRLPADSPAKGAEFIYLNETVTGIKAIGNEQISGDCYNLNGQRVDKNYKGVVIVNGKKMINK